MCGVSCTRPLFPADTGILQARSGKGRDPTSLFMRGRPPRTTASMTAVWGLVGSLAGRIFSDALRSTLRNSGGEAQSLEDSVQQGGRNFHGFAGYSKSMNDPIIEQIEALRCRRGGLTAERRNRGYTLIQCPIRRTRRPLTADRRRRPIPRALLVALEGTMDRRRPTRPGQTLD